MGRISKRLKRQLSKVITGQVSPGFDLYQVAQQAKDQTEPIEMPDHFRDFHPVHAVYLAAQNRVSFLAEQLSVLPELVEYYEMMVEAEDAYMPDGPPLSPLTRTYFTTWAFFDAPFGRDRETIGTCVLDLGPDLGLAWDYLEIIRLMQQSRMGLYEHQGVRGEYVHLQELITGQTHPCRVPAGYLGQAGELWYARIFPAPFGLSEESLVFTTPYLLISPAKKHWLDFLERTMPKTGLPLNQPALTETGLTNSYPALDQLLKYGLSRNYWHEFVFQAYVDNRSNVIFLTGLPDGPASLPHTS